MRIAVFHDLPSGGAKRTLYESMKRLSGRHSLDVYTLSTADQDFCSLNEFSSRNFVYPFSPSAHFKSPFGRLNQFQRWRDLYRLDRLARNIAKEIDAGKYDVVFAQPCMWTQAPLLLRYLRTPAVYYCHEPPRHLYEAPFRAAEKKSKVGSAIDYVDPLIWLYKHRGQRLDRRAVRAARRTLVNSTFIQDRVRQIYGVEPVISYHGVDTEVFRPAPDAASRRYVLSVGAIQPHKGYDFLIESLGHVDQAIRPSLHLIGNMENPQEQIVLRKLAGDLGVDLHIEVSVDQNTLVQRYNQAQFIVYAPYNEPFGLVPLEAMACGKPVVGIQEGGVKETVVHEFTGLVVERDACKFGKAVQFLLENPSRIEEYGMNGRAHVLGKWSWEKSVLELEKNLYSIARQSRH